jgi:RNA polymerase sigma-70 factor (ECF subfamily)
MDTDVIVRAQRGDPGAYALIATDIGDRFLAVARRILRDLDLAEDATQQALIAVWQNIPQLRDPARFEAWSYRLLVRACYAEGRRQRRWAPNLRRLPSDEPVVDDLSSVVDRDQLERGFRSLSIDHRTVVVLYHYSRPAARTDRRNLRHPDRDGTFPTPSRDARTAGGARRRPAPGGPGGQLMHSDQDVTRLVRSWLQTDEHESANRVVTDVLARLDAIPQHRSSWPVRRNARMNAYAKLALAAAAMLVVAVVGISLLPNGGRFSGGPAVSSIPSTTPSIPPSHPCQVTPGRWKHSFSRNEICRSGKPRLVLLRRAEGRLDVRRRLVPRRDRHVGRDHHVVLHPSVDHECGRLHRSLRPHRTTPVRTLHRGRRAGGSVRPWPRGRGRALRHDGRRPRGEGGHETGACRRRMLEHRILALARPGLWREDRLHELSDVARRVGCAAGSSMWMARG